MTLFKLRLLQLCVVLVYVVGFYSISAHAGLSPDLEKVRKELGLQVGEYESRSGIKCGGGLVTLRPDGNDVLLTIGATPFVFPGLGDAASRESTEKDGDCSSVRRTDRSSGRIVVKTQSSCTGSAETEIATLTIQGRRLLLDRTVQSKKSAKPSVLKCEWAWVRAEGSG